MSAHSHWKNQHEFLEELETVYRNQKN